MSGTPRQPADYPAAIKKSGLTIYDAIEIGSELWIPSPDLEAVLKSGLKGFKTGKAELRTRSKMFKVKVCEILGYPVPKSFKKCKLRFSGQNFDTYVQTADNLQVWNEEVSPARRYVVARPDKDSEIWRVRVLNGVDLALLDKTGKRTQKYQARLVHGADATELVSIADTDVLSRCVSTTSPKKFTSSPIDYPTAKSLLPIREIYKRLRGLVGRTFADAGGDQRNRGAGLHRLVCEALGYPNYRDDGRFPDVKNQLLEVKLQTALTIDLGLVTPASETPLEFPKIAETQSRQCDVRYALFYGESDGVKITLTRLYLTTGADFFKRFPRSEGKIVNKKLQLPLPKDFFTLKTERPAH